MAETVSLEGATESSVPDSREGEEFLLQMDASGRQASSFAGTPAEKDSSKGFNHEVPLNHKCAKIKYVSIINAV